MSVHVGRESSSWLSAVRVLSTARTPLIEHARLVELRRLAIDCRIPVSIRRQVDQSARVGLGKMRVLPGCCPLAPEILSVTALCMWPPSHPSLRRRQNSWS